MAISRSSRGGESPPPKEPRSAAGRGRWLWKGVPVRPLNREPPAAIPRGRRLYYFAAAFAVSLILVGALLGFALVELSTDTYMPGQFSPILQAQSVGEEGFTFTAWGEPFHISGETLEDAGRTAYRFRGLLPAGVRWSALASSRACAAVGEAVREREARETEYWDWS